MMEPRPLHLDIDEEMSVTYKLLPEKISTNTSAMPPSCWVWPKKQVVKVMSTLMSMQDSQDNLIIILKITAKKSELFVAKQSGIQVSIPQCVALCNDTSGTTSVLYHLTQSLGAFSPLRE